MSALQRFLITFQHPILKPYDYLGKVELEMLDPDKQVCIKNLESRIKYLISSIPTATQGLFLKEV